MAARVPTTAPAPITTAPLVGRDVPDQIDPGVMREEHNSGSIEVNLQTGTITERWILQGNPWEAFRGPGMQGLQVKDVHRWFAGNGDGKYAYLTKARFEHHIKAEQQEERFTMGTFVWQLRPCPHAFEEEEVGTLISLLTWWSQDDPPLRIGDANIGMSILSPSRLLIRRYPAVELSGRQIKKLTKELGKLNPTEFAGEGAEFWLFQNIRRKMLHGNALTLDGTYEITLYFLGDPLRHHELWNPKKENGVLLPPASNSFADLRAVHKASSLYPVSSKPFDDLVDISAVIDKCFPPGGGL